MRFDGDEILHCQQLWVPLRSFFLAGSSIESAIPDKGQKVLPLQEELSSLRT